MDENKKFQLENLNFTKTILMILIVLYHSMLFYTGNWFNVSPAQNVPIFSLIAQWLGSFHIYTFTLVSGYIFYYLKFERGKYQKFKLFLWNKGKRLLVPYLFIALVWIIPFNIFFFHSTVKEILFNYALGISPSQLWFLLMLFFTFVLAYSLSYLITKNIQIGGVIVLGSYALSMILSHIAPNVFQIFTSMQYLLYFWIGMMIRKYGLKWLNKVPSFVYLAIDVVLFVAYKFCQELNQSFFIKVLLLGLGIVLHIVGSIMAFIICDRIANKVNYSNSKNYLFISRYTFPIYLLHQQLIYCVISIFNGRIHPIFIVTISFISSFSIALVISWVLNKNKITRFLIGSK